MSDCVGIVLGCHGIGVCIVFVWVLRCYGVGKASVCHRCGICMVLHQYLYGIGMVVVGCVSEWHL